MTLQEVITKTQVYLNQFPLPGARAHRKLAPYPGRINVIPDTNYRSAAVLILLHEEESQPHLSFIRRNKRIGDHHSGQIAFPGGQIESSDQSLFDTATRESKEELGINPQQVNFVAQLTPIHIPVSKYTVVPFLAFIDQKPQIRLQVEEVSEYISAPIKAFLEIQSLPVLDIIRPTGNIIDVPYYPLQSDVIWGATAMMLAEFLEILSSP